MSRRPNDRPTIIYWLLDTRDAGWPHGEPFYCGKTVFTVERRVAEHRWTASRFPGRRVSQRILHVGEHLRGVVMEVVPVDGDWADRERHWIRILRHTFPAALNVTDGGQGAPGNIHTPEARIRIRFKNIGKKRSKASRKRIGAAVRRWRKIWRESLPPSVATTRILRRAAARERVRRLGKRRARP